jgi:hypothetical protein
LPGLKVVGWSLAGSDPIKRICVSLGLVKRVIRPRDVIVSCRGKATLNIESRCDLHTIRALLHGEADEARERLEAPQEGQGAIGLRRNIVTIEVVVGVSELCCLKPGASEVAFASETNHAAGKGTAAPVRWSARSSKARCARNEHGTRARRRFRVRACERPEGL